MSTSSDDQRRKLLSKNRRVLKVALLSAAVMLGLSFAFVPLYRLFCQVTGFGGTPVLEISAPLDEPAVLKDINVRFVAHTARGLPWDFYPETNTVTTQTGKTHKINYKAVNRSDRPITGVASFNVLPRKAGQYFVKIACFCFQEQTILPNQTVSLPVVFSVDPSIALNPGMENVKTITLSYTFFENKIPENEFPGDLENTSPHNGEHPAEHGTNQ